MFSTHPNFHLTTWGLIDVLVYLLIQAKSNVDEFFSMLFYDKKN